MIHIKETSFVYHGKRRFFLHFGQKSGKIKQNRASERSIGCSEAHSFVFNGKNSPKTLVYFLRFFAPVQDTAVRYAEVRTWLNTFIEQTMQGDALTTVDGTTMKMLVDRIQIRNEGIVVEFKCGVSIEQEYIK